MIHISKVLIHLFIHPSIQLSICHFNPSMLLTVFLIPSAIHPSIHPAILTILSNIYPSIRFLVLFIHHAIHHSLQCFMEEKFPPPKKKILERTEYSENVNVEQCEIFK